MPPLSVKHWARSAGRGVFQPSAANHAGVGVVGDGHHGDDHDGGDDGEPTAADDDDDDHNNYDNFDGD